MLHRPQMLHLSIKSIGFYSPNGVREFPAPERPDTKIAYTQLGFRNEGRRGEMGVGGRWGWG